MMQGKFSNMSESTKKVLELTQMIAAVRADKHVRHDSLTLKEESSITESIKSMSKELVSLIIDGAKPEEDGTLPHGMVQYTALKGKPMPYFEVGSLTKTGKRAQGFTIESAVANWNSDTYI